MQLSNQAKLRGKSPNDLTAKTRSTQELVAALRASLSIYPKGRVFNEFRLSDYLGTPREVYKISTSEIQRLAKSFLREHGPITAELFQNLLDQLYQGASYTERQVASTLLGLNRSFRQTMPLANLDTWLGNLEGWCEIDNLCQSNFSAAEVLARWPEWEKLLTKFASVKNISKRRASLVLLTKPVGQSDDPRLAKLAFTHIEKLETEREILITKAISWLLRSLITHHRSRVENYLANHQATLPKIAIREVARKLATGKK